jgi:hypothetical protein
MCQSHNGAIKVLLPRDFTGLVGYRTHNGSTLFSPAVKGCMTTFSVTRGVGKCFIGDWQHAEFSPQIAPAAAAQHPVDAPRHLSPTDTASSGNTGSCPSSPGSPGPRSHMRRISATSTYYEAPVPDPQVRIWSPEPSSHGDYEYAASSVGSSSGAASAVPHGTASIASSSTLLPSHSASQIGTGQNLSPTPFYANGLSDMRTRSPKSHARVPTPSTVSSSTYVQSSSNSLLDDASLSWQGDLLEVDTVNGTIRIAFVDEPKESKTGSIAQGAARLVKSWLAERGVNADKLVGLTREASGWMKGV